MAAHPTTRQGDRGPIVLALQRTLHHALGVHSVNRANGVYGSLTKRDVERWKQSVGIRPADGSVFGDRAWDRMLARNTTPQVAKLLAEDEAKRAAQARKAAELAAGDSERQVRLAVVAEMEWLLAHAGEYVYSMTRPIVDYDVRASVNRRRLDCSSTVTCCYHGGGMSDPNGLGYNGQGFTGTLWVRGERTYHPLPGDLAFFGWDPRGWPTHVAMHLEDPTDLGSFGHTPPTRYTAGVAYRTDYVGSRTY